MDEPFDTEKTDSKLSEIREREEEDLAQILSSKYGMPYADLAMKQIDPDALRVVPEPQARKAEVAAFAKVAKSISLAVHNPNNPETKKMVADLSERGYSVEPYLVSKKSLDKAYNLYKDLSSSVAEKPGFISVSDADFSNAPEEGVVRSELKANLEAIIKSKALTRVTKIIETLFSGAFALRASDIHFEPGETATTMRFRIDGVLSEVYAFPPEVYHQLNARFKLLSGVKINVTDRAQDGRFSIARDDVEVEMRVSFIPGNYGESIVMRILDPSATKVSYKDLGIHPKLLARLEEEIKRPNGMLLTTGPTGSGKTTTLYSFLREINSPENKIITIEDPIEYHLDGIVQTQVEGKKYTFADGLRAIVRQDPDIIMVGEIRDGETADIAVQAALTGHFVFSTLHTNDAAGTFPRLVDLGSDPKSFGSAVTVSMAQRLVRKLDPTKKKERPLTDAEKKMIDAVLASVVDKSLIPENRETVWEPVVTDSDDTGYHGRVGLYEAIFMDDELATFLRDNPPANDIATMAAKQGYLTMAQDGVIKALTGVTSLAEVSETVVLPRV